MHKPASVHLTTVRCLPSLAFAHSFPPTRESRIELPLLAPWRRAASARIIVGKNMYYWDAGISEKLCHKFRKQPIPLFYKAVHKPFFIEHGSKGILFYEAVHKQPIPPPFFTWCMILSIPPKSIRPNNQHNSFYKKKNLSNEFIQHNEKNMYNLNAAGISLKFSNNFRK